MLLEMLKEKLPGGNFRILEDNIKSILREVR